MDIDNIDRWDLIRHRLKNGPADEVFIEFANLTSKFFMRDEPEKWYRFCDGEFTETSFHHDWLKMVEEGDKSAIECAREHHKTSWVLNYILFRLWREDNFSCLYFSATHGQAKAKLRELQTLYERNKHWMDWEPSDDTWSKTNKMWENGSDIKAEGWGTAVEGAHVQLIVMDDILQEEGTGGMNDEQNWNFYSRIISPMVTESGKIVLVGTKKRRGDIFDKVEKNPEWEHARYPSTPDNVIFPEKWPKERLLAKKREMMARNFNREFGLDVVVDDEVLIPPTWNERNRDQTIGYPEEYQGGFNVCGFDPAISPTGDYAAFFCMSLKDSGKREVLHIERKQGMSLGDMMMKLHQLDTRYGFQQIIIEQNSFQRIIVNEAIDRTSLPISGHETTRSKSDPAEGLPRIAVLFENGKYLYPYKEYEDVEKTDMVHQALNSLKYEQGTIANNHTPDIVMAKYLAEQAIMKFESSQNVLDEPFVVGVRGSL